MMKNFLFAFLLTNLALTGCSTGKVNLSEISGDALFAKRLQCGQFLEKIDWSVIGPKGKYSSGVLPLNPLVFYSSRLNTCVYIQSSIEYGIRNNDVYRNESIDAYNLLTGQTLERQDFDLVSRSGATSVITYQNQLEQKYNK
jgi:hypothetical protein